MARGPWSLSSLKNIFSKKDQGCEIETVFKRGKVHVEKHRGKLE